MNKRGVLLVTGIICVLLAGCMAGTVTIPQPASQSASGIVLKIPGICPALMQCANQTVTFARLDDGNNIISNELYQTSIMQSDHYYLLNARPGKYVAVAATYSRGTGISGFTGKVSGEVDRVFGENILFSEALVRKTMVEIVPGSLVVMGAFDFGIDGRMALAPSAAQFIKNADAVQLHYAKAIDPDMESRGATSSIKFYRGTLKLTNNDAGTKRKLLESASRHIGTGGWDSQITSSQL